MLILSIKTSKKPAFWPWRQLFYTNVSGGVKMRKSGVLKMLVFDRLFPTVSEIFLRRRN